MLYNNIDMSDYMRIIDVRGRGITEQELTTVRVIGSDEDYVTYRTKPPRYLEIDYEIRAKDKEELRKKIDAVSAIIETNEKVPIIFPDESDRVYYGEYAGVEENVEYHHVGIHRGTIYILRDKYKYGHEKTVETTSDTLIVENEGTAEAEPIFELEVLQPTTFAMVSNGEEYMMVGKPIEAGDVPVKPFERILVDELGTLVGWTPLPGGAELPYGLVGGNMKTTGGSFEAETFGSNPNGWVGPAVRKSFSEPLQDFAIDIEVTSRNTQGQAGRLQALLLDASDNVVATMSLIDGTIDRPQNRALFTVGNRTIMNEYGDNHGAYNNETMHLNLTRKGNEFIAYAYKQTGSIRTGRVRRTFYDTQLEHQAPIRQIVLYISKYKNYLPYPMSFNKLVVDKLYQPDELEIPYIADVGDEIVFDHKTGDCYINGEPVPFDFGADFFTLKKGINTLTVMPENTFDTKVTFRDRYL